MADIKQIHNVAVARVLANLLPQHFDVDLVNQVILDKTFGNEEEYKNFVDELKKACTGSQNDEAFYAAFGLSSDGTLLESNDVYERIKAQNDYNVILFYAYTYPERYADANKMFLSLLLSLEKEEEFYVEGDELGVLQSAFLDSRAHFIKEVDSLLDINMADALEEYSADELKKVRENIKLNSGVQHTVKSGSSESMPEQQVPDTINIKFVEKFLAKIDFITQIKDVHLYSPLFQSKASAALKEYRQIAEDCALISSQLLQRIELLQQDSNPASEREKETARLLELVKKYNEIDQMLSAPNGIINKITGVQSKSRQLAYAGEGITIRSVSQDALQNESGLKPSAEQQTAVTQNYDAHAFKAELLEQPKSGSLLAFDVSYSDANGRGVSKGRFVYDPGTLANNADSARLAVQKFPQKADGAPGSEEAKVNFAFAMAAETLGRFGKPSAKNPLILRGSNEEELKYLWTALMVLGQNNPQMKFGADALSVRSNAFKPDSEQGTFFRFNNNSLYERVFKRHMNENAIFDQYKELGQQAADKKEINSFVKNAQRVTKNFKDQLHEVRENERERMKSVESISERKPDDAPKPTK